MTPQPRTPLTSKASTIRSHSPYSTGKGPIVNEGFVAARVRAIQGRFQQTKTPQYPEPRNDSALPKKPLDRSIHSLKESPSFRNFSQLSIAQDLNNSGGDRSRRSQLSSRKWQRSTSSLRSPYVGLPTGLQTSSDRKVHSMWDLHTRYQGSPHGGRKRYRDYSNLRRISAGTETGTSEIISPQPLSPYKQPVSVSQQNTDDSGFGSEMQAEQEYLLPVSKPRKSIAEALGNIVDVTKGQDEASTAWAAEDEKPECPFPATEPLADQSTPEVQQSERAGPFDRKAYSQYIARTLPSFNSARSTATLSNEIHDVRPLRRMRGRRAAPDNTMVDSSEHDQQEGDEPLLPLKKRSRAATASHSGHSMSDTPRRATVPAPSIGTFIDRHAYESTEEFQKPDRQEEPKPSLPLKKRSRAATASYSGHSVSDVPRRATTPAPSIDLPFIDRHTYESTDDKPDLQEELKPLLPLKKRSRARSASYSGHSVSDAPRRATMPAPSIDPFIDHHAYEDTDEVQDTLQEFKTYKATESSKLRQGDAGNPTSQDALEIQRSDKPESSNSRRSSAISRAPSIALSRPLSRVWRRFSTWRLGFGARQSDSVELSLEQKSETEAPNRTGTDPQPHVNNSSRRSSGRLRSFTYRGLLDLSTDSAASNIAGSDTETDEQPHRGSPKDKSLSSRSATPNPDELQVIERKPLDDESEDGHTLGEHSRYSTDASSPHPELTDRDRGHLEESDEESEEYVDRYQSAAEEEKHIEQGNAASDRPSPSFASPNSVLSSSSLGGKALKEGNATSGRPSTSLAPQDPVRSSKASGEGVSRQGNAASGRPSTSLPPQDPVRSSKASGEGVSRQGNAASGRPSTSLPPQNSVPPSNSFPPSTPKTIAQKGDDSHLLSQELSKKGALKQGNAASGHPSTSLAPQSSAPSSNSFPPLTPKTVAEESEEHQLLPQEPVKDPQPSPQRSGPTTEIASTPPKTPPPRSSRPPPLSLNCSHPSSKPANHSTHNPAPQQNPIPNHHASNPTAAPPTTTPPTPLAPTDRRPPLSATYSLRPSPAHPTTELSTPDPINWTPSRGRVLPRTYSSLHAQPTTPSRAQSPAPSYVSETETVDSVASSSAYASLRGSRQGLRAGSAARSLSAVRSSSVLRERRETSGERETLGGRTEYELRGCREREQRIRRVKVVVSLDGGPDLVVDAVVQGGREGGRAEWRVREGVRERVEEVEG